MRILICATAITKGSGFSQYVVTLASTLTTMGDEVGVITTHGSNPNYEKNVLKENGVKSLWQFHRFNKYIKYYKLLKFIFDWSPDVIINNFNAPIQFLLPLFPQKCKLIHILHCDDVIYYRVAALNAKWVKHWISPSKTVAEHFSAYTNHKWDDKIHVIPHGVSPAIAHRRTEIGTPNITFIGVIDQHKGAQNLPPIIKQLHERGYNFHFTIIGEGGMMKRLETELNQEIVHGIVRFTGIIESKYVYEYLSNTDIFVFPTHFESFGLVIAEAMMNGAVPVTTHIKGVTDTIISDGIDGYLIRQDCVEDFVEKISVLIEDKELLKRMSVAAKEKAESTFSLNIMAEKYYSYFR